MFCGVSNHTTIFVNSPGFCRPCGFGRFRAFSPGCFGYGFNCIGNPMTFGAGVGLGYAAGMMLPAVVTGIGKGCAWLWNKIFK